MQALPEAVVPIVQTKIVSMGLSAIFLLSTICCITGYRWSTIRWTTLALTLILFGFRNSFGHAFRSELVLILAQFVFVFAPASDGMSIDARSRPPREDSPDYQWPLAALQVLWVSIFFFGGLSKLRNSSFTWATENFLAEYLWGNQITRAGTLADRSFSEYGLALLERPEATLALGYIVLVFELSYPLIFLKKFRALFLVSTFAFQLGVFVFLGVNFWFYIPLILVWAGPNVEHLIRSMLRTKV
jgi:hypothetical protein